MTGSLPSLLNASKLKEILKAQSAFVKHFRLLDANMGTDMKESFMTGHIKNSVYFDTMHCTTPTQLFPRNLPEPTCFKDYVGTLGISNKHHLIVYDRSPFGFYASSRTWWIFRLFGHERVSILNGGLRNWLLEENDLSNELANFKKEEFRINLNKDLLRNFDSINQNIVTKKEEVIDARGPTDFNKIDPEDQRINHIANSKNVPYTELFDKEKGLLKDNQELLELFKKSGVDMNKPLVTSCLTGMTASSLAFAASLIGLKEVSVYAGSWTEYSQRRKN